MPRLVTCHLCRVLQRIPDPAKGTPFVPARLTWEDSSSEYVYKDPDNGLPVMVPAYDPVLEDFVTKHQHGQDDSIFVNGAIQVWAIDADTWNAVDVVKQIQGQLHDQTNKWYEDRDTYRDGATACYNDHNNPTIETGCSDFMDDSKRIGDTHYRDDEGHRRLIPRRHQMYLCHLCPYYQSSVITEVRRKAGMYK